MQKVFQHAEQLQACVDRAAEKYAMVLLNADLKKYSADNVSYYCGKRKGCEPRSSIQATKHQISKRLDQFALLP